MIGEVDFAGVFVPTALIAAVLAYVLALLLRRFLAICGFYRLVWQRGWFDFALFILLLGAIAARFLPFWLAVP